MDPHEFSALRLAREGLGGGDPDAVMQMPATTVLNLIEYLNFESDYQDQYQRLNAPQK